jgi:hypothetical protein
MSSRHVEHATGHPQNATTLSKQSVPPINDTVWSTIVGSIIGSIIGENNNNTPKGPNTDQLPTYATFWFGLFQSLGAIVTAAGLFFVGWQAMSTRAQLKVMKQQLGRAWIGFDGREVPHMDFKSKEVIFPYKNFGTIPAKIVKAISLSSMNEPTEDQLRSASPSRDNMQAVLYPSATREFRAVHNTDSAYFGIFFEYEYADNLKGEYGFIVRITYEPGNISIYPRSFSLSLQKEFFK